MLNMLYSIILNYAFYHKPRYALRTKVLFPSMNLLFLIILLNINFYSLNYRLLIFLTYLFVSANLLLFCFSAANAKKLVVKSGRFILKIPFIFEHTFTKDELMSVIFLGENHLLITLKDFSFIVSKNNHLLIQFNQAKLRLIKFKTKSPPLSIVIFIGFILLFLDTLISLSQLNAVEKSFAASFLILTILFLLLNRQYTFSKKPSLHENGLTSAKISFENLEFLYFVKLLIGYAVIPKINSGAWLISEFCVNENSWKIER